MSEEWHIGDIYEGAKNHAICQGALKVAHVLGGGYPSGKGWAPHTERLTREIVHKLNCYDELLEALQGLIEMASPFMSDDVQMHVLKQARTALANAATKEYRK